MATLKNTIKKAEKLSGEKIQKNENNLHFVNYKGYSVSFYPNGRMAENVESTNFYTTKEERTENDHQSDYFPGCFHENITQCFSHIDYMTKSR